MAKDILESANRLLLRKRYSDVISLLEPVALDVENSTYKNSFAFYYYLGLAFLYTGDVGGAASYFERARKIRMRDPDLIVGQAAIFLRKGQTPQACRYYLDALHLNRDHPKAKRGLDFLQHADEDAIVRLVESGKITRFYPVLKRKKSPFAFVAFVACLCLLAGGFLFFRNSDVFRKDSERMDLSAFELTAEEKSNLTEQGGTYRYNLTEREIDRSYEAIKTYIHDFRDNAAQVEINRLLNSNASSALRNKAMGMMRFLPEQGFDTIKDNYPYSKVKDDPGLYSDCWVVWSGMATNVRRGENATDFDFLVGYDRKSDLQGIVRVHFPRALSFIQDRPFEVLGQIKQEGTQIVLRGASIHQ